MPLTVAIVGRPNVGKSTLFNRLVGRRMALVDDRPGVTRDRREGDGRLGDLDFRLIDTAGFEDARGHDLAARVQAQTERALELADVVLFLIDGRDGVTPLDHHFALVLRRSGVPVILIANKCEGQTGEAGRGEAYGLGLGDPLPLSAEHGLGLELLYDALRPHADAHADAEVPGTGEGAAGADEAGEAPLQLAVVGRPNVGKSTLVNRILGEDRLVTGPEAGITRDAIAIDWTFAGRRLRLIDTAGMRKQARITDRLEELSVADARRAIRFAQVVVLVIDGTLGVDRQDLVIAGMIADEGRAPVVALNKWDLVAERGARVRAIAARFEDALPALRGITLAPLSALTGEGLDQLLPAVLRVFDVWNCRVPTPSLNRWLEHAVDRHPPPAPGGRPLRIRYMTQAKVRPPSFVLFANRPAEVPESYLRYLANGLREAFDLPGVPLRLTLRRSRNPFAGDPGKS